jgi:hypothetical protein
MINGDFAGSELRKDARPGGQWGAARHRRLPIRQLIKKLTRQIGTARLYIRLRKNLANSVAYYWNDFYVGVGRQVEESYRTLV